METASYRGVVEAGKILFDDPDVTLPDGTHVVVTPLEEAPARGTAAAILAAMRSEPHVTKEDVAELKRLIAEGRRPVTPQDIFPPE